MWDFFITISSPLINGILIILTFLNGRRIDKLESQVKDLEIERFG